MAVKASATVTLSSVVDVKSVWRYYKLQVSTLSKPSKPTTNPPSGWTTTEPSYTNGSTNSLYFCDLTVFCDNTFVYSDVSLSSSYEAAKAAYNKAVAADNKAQEVATRVTNAETSITNNKNAIELCATKTEVTQAVNNISVGGRNLILNSADSFGLTGFNQKGASIYEQGWTSSQKYLSGLKGQRWTTDPSRIYSGPYFDYHDKFGVTLKVGEIYTFSAWMRVDKNGGKEIRGVSESHQPIASDLILTTDWRRIWVTFKALQVNSNVCFYFDHLDAGHVYLLGMKLEKGNKATDWSPAPEDLQKDATTKADNALASAKTYADAQIKVSADSITSTVSKTYQPKGDYATNSTLQTQLSQTNEEIRMDFNKSIASASSDLQSQMDVNNTAVNTKLSEINKYIRFVDGKIVLGETGNELMLTIQNDRVSFTQAGVEVAYFSNNNLYIKKAEVLTTLRVGNYEFAPRTDGGLALRKWSG